MCAQPPSSRPPRRSRPKAASTTPGELPPNFPEAAPLSDDGLEAAKKEVASPMKQAAESAAPDTDPLQRRTGKLEEQGKG